MPDEWVPARKHGTLPDGRVLISVRGNVPEDRMFLVKVRRPRSVKHHRLYWGMLRAVCEVSEGEDRWKTPVALHRWIKYQLGMYTIVAVDKGKSIVEWDSTDFYSMSQTAFEQFFEKAVKEIIDEIKVDPLSLIDAEEFK